MAADRYTRSAAEAQAGADSAADSAWGRGRGARCQGRGGRQVGQVGEGSGVRGAWQMGLGGGQGHWYVRQDKVVVFWCSVVMCSGGVALKVWGPKGRTGAGAEAGKHL